MHMSSAGYILLSRQMIESDIWRKPPLYIKIWLYLLIKAQYRDYRKLKRGQTVTSIADIQEECSWYVGYRKEKPSKDQVYQVIDWMRRKGNESDEDRDTNPIMITTSKATHGLIITIENYDFYQDPLSYASHSETNSGAEMGATKKPQSSDNINKASKHSKQKNKKKVGTYDEASSNQSCNSKWEQFVIR